MSSKNNMLVLGSNEMNNLKNIFFILSILTHFLNFFLYKNFLLCSKNIKVTKSNKLSSSTLIMNFKFIGKIW
nr:ATP synthase F0 subunit 8 [Neohydatothrips samayunkur]